MPLTKNADRQWPLAARVDFTQEDLATGVTVEAIDIPGGATIMYGSLVITTAGDSVTSDTVVVGDTSPSLDRYATAVNGKTAGRTALTIDGLVNDATGKGAVTITNTAVGTEGTAMVGYLEVFYTIAGRGNESQPV